jgi:hypothetical protein
MKSKTFQQQRKAVRQKQQLQATVQQHVQKWDAMKLQLEQFQNSNRFLFKGDYAEALEMLQDCFVRIRDEKTTPVLFVEKQLNWINGRWLSTIIGMNWS